jgi:hypothetical protein
VRNTPRESGERYWYYVRVPHTEWMTSGNPLFKDLEIDAPGEKHAQRRSIDWTSVDKAAFVFL